MSNYAEAYRLEVNDRVALRITVEQPPGFPAPHMRTDSRLLHFLVGKALESREAGYTAPHAMRPMAMADVCSV